MLNQYETDIANVESVQSFVNMKQFDDYDKMGTILTRKKLEHSYRLLSSMSATGKLFLETLDDWQFFLQSLGFLKALGFFYELHDTIMDTEMIRHSNNAKSFIEEISSSSKVE